MPPSISTTLSNGVKRKVQIDSVDAAHEKMVNHMVASSSSGGSSAIPPAQYLQDGFADCVEHRVADPIQFMLHHLRHLKLVLTSDLSNNIIAPMIPTVSPTSIRTAAAPSMVPGSPTAPLACPSTGQFRFFDRLHRYVFQHAGGRALRACFFVFQHAEELERASVVSSSPPNVDSANFLTASSSRLALRSSLFSCFSDLFFASQRLDQASNHSSPSAALPANEFSRIPTRLVVAFCSAVLEEQLMCLANPMVLLTCIISLFRFSVRLLEDNAASTSQYLEGHFKYVYDWVEFASSERSSAVLRSLVKAMEDLLRCGPTTIVTATTRKKKQDTSSVIPSAVLGFSFLGSNAEASVAQNSSSVDDSVRDGILRILDIICGSNTAETPLVGSKRNATPPPGSSLVKSSIDLSGFKAMLTLTRSMVQLYRSVSLPFYSLLESRCSLISTSEASISTIVLPLPQAISVMQRMSATLAYKNVLERACSLQEVVQKLCFKNGSQEKKQLTQKELLDAFVVALNAKSGNAEEPATFSITYSAVMMHLVVITKPLMER